MNHYVTAPALVVLEKLTDDEKLSLLWPAALGYDDWRDLLAYPAIAPLLTEGGKRPHRDTLEIIRAYLGMDIRLNGLPYPARTK